jgi:CubicO group peptidase (beta-lactamase class C family)
MISPKKVTTIIPIVLLMIMGIFSACEQQPTTEAIEKSSYVVDTLMTTQNIPGVQLAVWKEGEIVFSEGFGHADLEHDVPMSPDTKLRIGSVSKTLTSAAVGKLFEEGKLDFDAPVQEYVSYFPEKEYPITVRQVVGHTAGIRHYRGEEFLMNKRFESVKEGVEIFDEDTLLFEPGTDYSYSSYGWNLISAVVEGAADTTFLSYMDNEIFNPLGMDETEAEYTDSLIYDRSSYYSEGENGEILNAPAVDNSYKWAGGGFIGTAEDLTVFGEQIFWGDFLESETVDILTESLELDSGEKTNYGIGWQIGVDDQDRRYYGHSGGSVGGTTQFVVFPEQEVIVAIVANIGGVSYRDAHLIIADFFMDESTTPSE